MKVKIPYELKRCIECCVRNDMDDFARIWNGEISEIESLILEIRDQLLSNKIIEVCKKVRENVCNNLLCSYYISEELLPLIYCAMERISLNSGESDIYDIIKTKSGLFTLRKKKSDYYYHDLVDPMYEAGILAKYLYRKPKRNIIIIGIGLGYLGYSIWLESSRSANIYYFDNDPEIINLAMSYGMLGLIPNERLHVVVNQNDNLLFDAITNINIDLEDSILWISPWIEETICDENIKQSIRMLCENRHTVEQFRQLKEINSMCNISAFTGDVEDIKNVDNSIEEYIVIAAGPSLDDDIAYIQSEKNKKRIIAVESVLRKLINCGVIPDYVVVLDPTEEIMNYLSGIEEFTSSITLIADENAYWGYLESFNGKKFKADKNTKYEWGNHSSVTCLAIDIAIYLGAAKIELIGVDLAYPNKKFYASGLVEKEERLLKSSKYVRSVCDGMVESSEVFIQFRTEIEAIASKHTGVRIENRSKIGAYIRGAFCEKWWEKGANEKNLCLYCERLIIDTFLDWKEKYFIFWQIVYVFIDSFTNSANDETMEMISTKIISAYESIREAFLKEVEGRIICNEKIENDGKLVILLTSYLSLAGDNISVRVLEDAHRLKCQHGYNVMIVNTCEYLGGTESAIDNKVLCSRCSELENKNDILYLGEKIPYFQFGNNMPDIDQTISFLNRVPDFYPKAFVVYDRFSLVAEACKLVGNVEYR